MNYPVLVGVFSGVCCLGLLNILVYVYLRVRGLGLKRTRVKTMIVLGSGGHTAEMLKLISYMDLYKYAPRVYVVAETDSHSESKAIKQEMDMQDNLSEPKIFRIPRSREVGQSYFTSFLTTCYSFAFGIVAVLIHRPDVVLVNGPGTCIPIVVAATIFRCMGLISGKVIYIESIARVTRLSLSGKILYYLGWADSFEVMWKRLTQKYPRAHFAGRLY
eukprot:TRINITY_DN9004_c0_g1_i4.p1 TRINITY_DN9004_c0_g1~~TRINITY_DN9004_c0_g1_i4.p1  ORF type:complete len:217 (-),score=10.44 TRINITY_DN9004_c0_g1_i4:228-878(-)